MGDFGLLRFVAGSGGEWVIWILGICSVVVVAVMIERYAVLGRERRFADGLKDRVWPLVAGSDWRAAARALEKEPGSAARILKSALERPEAGVASLEERAAAARVREKRVMEERLLILGTLGNNAPFIGLFGTVLGVIKAFRDLAQTQAGPEVVMQGLSEALIATAVGLLVAIPAVMAYNYFQKIVSDVLSESDALVRDLVSRLKETTAPR